MPCFLSACRLVWAPASLDPPTPNNPIKTKIQWKVLSNHLFLRQPTIPNRANIKPNLSTRNVFLVILAAEHWHIFHFCLSLLPVIWNWVNYLDTLVFIFSLQDEDIYIYHKIIKGAHWDKQFKVAQSCLTQKVINIIYFIS